MGQSRLPDFLGLGVQKGGTTTLHTLLAAHPQLMLPQKKKLQHPIRGAVKSLPITFSIPWLLSAFSVAALGHV